MSQYSVHKHISPVFSDEVLKKAIETPLCAYGKVNCYSELGGSGAFLYLLIRYRHDTSLKTAEGRPIAELIVDHARSLISGGKEPGMAAGPYWGYPLTAAALTLLRKTPVLWSIFTNEEKNKLDQIMRCFSIACSFATDDHNDFWTGLDLKGNYRKGWNPNHRSPSVLPIMFAALYFDSVKYVNDLLVNFEFDRFVADLDTCGFTVAAEHTRLTGKKLLEEGGDCFLAETGEPAGHGEGVRHPYVYRGIPLSDIIGIFDEILLQDCKGGIVVDKVKNDAGEVYAYLMNGSSPVLGLDGMMTEFTSHDAKGNRSDISYCAANFCILAPAMAAMVELGAWDPESERSMEASEKTAVSIIDFLYKIEHGYYSFSHGKGRPTDEKSTHDVYPFAKDLWKAMLA